MGAELHYAKSTYASSTVIQNRCKLDGWPTDVAWASFSRIEGGLPVLNKLLKDCKDGAISFKPATPEDIANAERDPATVHPNYQPPRTGDGIPSALAPSAKEDPVLVPSLVLRSDNMEEVGVELTSTQPSAAVLGRIPPRQRSDVKKPRHRDLTGPYCRPRPLPKEGVKSEPFILPESATGDHYLAPTLSEPSGHGGERPVRDPLLEILPAAFWYAPTPFGTPPSAFYGGAGGSLAAGMAMDVFGTAGSGTEGDELSWQFLTGFC